jgi:hypothetical protein
MILFDWNPLQIFTHPFAGALVAASLATLLWATVRPRRPTSALIEA